MVQGSVFNWFVPRKADTGKLQTALPAEAAEASKTTCRNFCKEQLHYHLIQPPKEMDGTNALRDLS